MISPKEEKYSNAFYHVLKDTLVGDDLVQANRIAYGKNRFRVVTIDGKLIDTSGTMSGGGTRVQRGGMNSKYVLEMTENQVALLEEERDKILQKIDSISVEIKQGKDVSIGIEKKLKELQVEARKVVMDLDSVETRIKDTEKNINDLKYFKIT